MSKKAPLKGNNVKTLRNKPVTHSEDGYKCFFLVQAQAALCKVKTSRSWAREGLRAHGLALVLRCAT